MYYVDQGIAGNHECQQHVVFGRVCRALDEEEYRNHIQTFDKNCAACDVFELFKSLVQPFYQKIIADKLQHSYPHQMTVLPQLRYSEHADQQGNEDYAGGDGVYGEQTGKGLVQSRTVIPCLRDFPDSYSGDAKHREEDEVVDY